MITMKEIFEKAVSLRRTIEISYNDIDVSDLVNWIEDRPRQLDPTFRLESNATDADIKSFELLSISMGLILRGSSNLMFEPTYFAASSNDLTRYMTEQMEYVVNELSNRISLREKAVMFEKNVAALKAAIRERNGALITGACHDLFLDDNWDLDMQAVETAQKYGINVRPAKVSNLGWPDLSGGVLVSTEENPDEEWTYSLV